MTFEICFGVLWNGAVPGVSWMFHLVCGVWFRKFWVGKNDHIFLDGWLKKKGIFLENVCAVDSTD
jgi:hypothetical protein